MKTNAVDLRHNMKDIMSAISRNEPVTLLYHGKAKAVISPIKETGQKDIKQHPFFGMLEDDATVDDIMDDLRGSRY